MFNFLNRYVLDVKKLKQKYLKTQSFKQVKINFNMQSCNYISTPYLRLCPKGNVSKILVYGIGFIQTTSFKDFPIEWEQKAHDHQCEYTLKSIKSYSKKRKFYLTKCFKIMISILVWIFYLRIFSIYGPGLWPWIYVKNLQLFIN